MRKSPEADRLYHKRYYAEHREKYRQRQYRWAHSHPREQRKRAKRSQKLYYKHRPRKTSDRAVLYWYHKIGYHPKKISQELNLSRETVYYYLEKHHLHNNIPGEIIREYRLGYTSRSISLNLNRSRSYINKRIHKYRKEQKHDN